MAHSSTESTPRFTYFLATRNDYYCGDMLRRLRTCLSQILECDDDAEIIVVDWGSERPLKDEFANVLPSKIADSIPIRMIRVPRAVTMTCAGDFNEVVSQNIAIRRARGEYLARIDQDILVGERWIESDLRFVPVGFSSRRDLPPLLYAADDSAQVNQPELLGTPKWHCGGVGVLSARRDIWHTCRGYDERLVWRNCMEIDLMLRMALLNGGTVHDVGKPLNYPFYHMCHPRPAGRRVNPWIELSELSQRIGDNPTINGDDWGMGGLELEEIIL
jgi:hypothetical protein